MKIALTLLAWTANVGEQNLQICVCETLLNKKEGL